MLQPGSPFGSLERAAEFLEYKPFGISVDERRGEANVVRIVRDEWRWRSKLVSVIDADWRFFADKAVTIALARDDLCNVMVDFGGGRVLTFDELLDTLARQQGHRHGARKVHLPWIVVSIVAVLTDALGGRGPITRDELTMLRHGNHTSNEEFVRLFGFAPAPFE